MPKQPHSERTAYPEVPQSLNLPAIEERIISFWEQDGTFQASIDQRPKGNDEFVFYDGPPFANGVPHYGHLLTGFVKDAVPRYKTMRGHRVERRFGWDCHGLPAEMTVEKDLEITDGKVGIERLGIGVFNDYCAQLVNRTADTWRHYVTRQARWVDFDNDYKTMDLDFMESVIWAFKSLYDKGLMYEGYRVLPYCWECETPLSNFETRQDDSYRNRVDPSVTVSFRLTATAQGPSIVSGEVNLLAWTTTPWTLPSNLAIAVGPDIEYTVLRSVTSGEEYVLASERVESYLPHLGEVETIGTVMGRELEGREFAPIFDYFLGHENAFKVLLGDFVTTDEGTGIVQMAPGFGEEDQGLCEQYGIAVVCPVDSRARFTAPVTEYEGVQVFEANRAIVRALRDRGVLISREEYAHSYPHCWRTDTPLIYRAISSWFVKVSALKERLLELNKQIEWVPEHVRDGAFGKWLEGARDWSITRNRYFGSPIPVWKSDDPRYPRIDVYGSLDEMERDFGIRPENLHRQYIDGLTRANPDDPTGQSRMVRVTDILDCWFESGSMPYAQLHYPFENREGFESHFPADFIVEYIGQTRGWFYTLHVLSVALFDKPPFEHCMAHGILLGDDGRKLSKRLKNYPDPQEVFDTIGADAMRWFLLSSSVLRGQDMMLEKRAMVDTVKRVINPIWNAYYFLTLYAGADHTIGTFDTGSTNLLDRYILAKTASLLASVTTSMDAYDLSSTAEEIEGFLDALTNWYIRRSRERFWSVAGASESQDQDKQAAYDTLHTVLITLCQISAPLLPMLTEEIYRTLSGTRSVHLTDWPDIGVLPEDPNLVQEMDLVREVCSLGHSIRKAQGIRARLPLSSITISGQGADRLQPYLSLIEDELNVKEVILEREFAHLATDALNVIPARVGRRLGPNTQHAMRHARTGNWSIVEGTLFAGDIALEEGEYELIVEPRDPNSTRVLSSRKGVVVLDLERTRGLELEGLARDLIREVQSARKDADLVITDRIELRVAGEINADLRDAISTHLALIGTQVLADSLTLGGPDLHDARISKVVEIEGSEVELSLTTVERRR